MSDFRLKVFQTVATKLSFTKAAQELFISQPAVTKNIKELEKLYDVRLLERKGSEILLTKAGEILLKYAGEIAAIYSKIDFELSASKNEYAGSLRIGASTTIGQYVLPEILARFNTSFPLVHTSLVTANTEKIEKYLHAGKIDLGIVEGKKHGNHIRYLPFMHDELVLIVNAKSTFIKEYEISQNELKTLPLLIRERGSGSLEVIEAALKKHTLKLSSLNILMTLGSTESIKNFLRHANCAGIVSVHAVTKELMNGEFRVIDVKDFEIKRTFYFIHRQGIPESTVKLFIDYTRNYNQRL